METNYTSNFTIIKASTVESATKKVATNFILINIGIDNEIKERTNYILTIENIKEIVAVGLHILKGIKERVGGVVKINEIAYSKKKLIGEKCECTNFYFIKDTNTDEVYKEDGTFGNYDEGNTYICAGIEETDAIINFLNA